MRYWKNVTKGITTGLLTSLISVVLVGVSWQVLSQEPTSASTILLLGLVNGAVLGLLCIAIKALSQGREHRIVGLLVSLAIGAVIVLLGRYPSGSWLPIAIYATALLNGLLIPQLTAVSTRRQTITF